jgi:hypothetical protein
MWQLPHSLHSTPQQIAAFVEKLRPQSVQPLHGQPRGMGIVNGKLGHLLRVPYSNLLCETAAAPRMRKRGDELRAQGAKLRRPPPPPQLRAVREAAAKCQHGVLIPPPVDDSEEEPDGHRPPTLSLSQLADRAGVW